ncbi:MAG: SH3 domain-containing protein [Lachnospiraceae bacterium]|nr:SH3 domain-containing protein [Lachnospiraceae bacterium]
MRKKLIPAMITAVTVAQLSVVNVLAAPEELPEVSPEMTEEGYFTAGREEADQVLLDAAAIQAINARIASTKECCMNDLENEKPYTDGLALNQVLYQQAVEDLTGFINKGYFNMYGERLSAEEAAAMAGNVINPNASEQQYIHYGICTTFTDLRVLPTEYLITDDPGDNDFDYLQNSNIRVNEPVVIRSVSADGLYYLVDTSSCSGWALTSDIAVCADKAEWLDAWKIPSENAIVVTEGRFCLEQSQTSPQLSGLALTMGTVLRKADRSDYGTRIENRSAYYNYPVWIPVRTADGRYSKALGLISMHHGVSEGYLPLTENNILKVAYSMLGDTYGWGGMLSSMDCSLYVQNIYKCFGLELPRNTTWQSKMPVTGVDVSAYTPEMKEAVLDVCPPGTLLYFSGHAMMYLGQENGNYYVISSVSSMMDASGTQKLRVRGVVINTLDTRRANGKTWLESIHTVLVPYLL